MGNKNQHLTKCGSQVRTCAGTLNANACTHLAFVCASVKVLLAMRGEKIFFGTKATIHLCRTACPFC